MKIKLPLPPNRANARGHWRKMNKEKKDYWGTCDMAEIYYAQHYGKLDPLPEKVGARATLYVWSKMDQIDNVYARLKWTWDWLEANGYIPNDRNVEWLEPPTQIVDRKDMRVEIELVAIETCDG